MKRLIVFLLLTLPVIYISCNSNDPASARYEYYYYPSINLYYDVAKNNYIYSVDGGNTWHMENGGSDTLPPEMGPKVLIYASGDSIWKENRQHLQQYGGSLYNVVDEVDTSQASERTAVTDKVKNKPVKKKPAEPAEAKPEKKGLGKLLNKIFGKKKKE